MNKITALLDAITEVIKNIGTLTESLQTVSNLLNEIKITEISKKSTVHTSESTGNSKVYSLEDVRGVLAKKSQSGLTSEVREIIVKYGGNKHNKSNRNDSLLRSWRKPRRPLGK